MQEMKGLTILNDNREIRKLLQKLPDWVVSRWSRIVSECKKRKGAYPGFAEFTEFMAEEASIACDPMTSLGSIRDHKEERAHKVQKKTREGTAKTLAAGTEVTKGCLYCEKPGHIVNECRILGSKALKERQAFVQKHGICYGCLQKGHMSKSCSEKSTCKTCSKRHPTCLHMEGKPPKEDEKTTNKTDDSIEEQKDDKKEGTDAICHKSSKLDCKTMTSMIVPVWVSSSSNPQKEQLVYALLDTQSDTTFVLEEVVDALQAPAKAACLKLATISSKSSIIHCRKVENLRIRGYDSSCHVNLPRTYTRDFIPTDRSHIPTPSTAREWPHLRRIAHLIPPLQDCEVGLLIGYDCPLALAPRSFITGEGNQPFALQTDLGWSIIGCANAEDDGDAIGVTCRTMIKEIQDELKPHNDRVLHRQEVLFTAKTAVKEVINIQPPDVIKILESDFKTCEIEDKQMSQDDLSFIKIMEKGIHQQDDGHYSMPLPFKVKPVLADNRHLALRRYEHLNRRFKSDPKYLRDYEAFMNEIIQRGDAEKIPEEEISIEKRWYIPHHGVYHPKKPEKIRVVFDCAAKCKGVSLTDRLLQGPDLTNSLVGVLVRFRQEPIALMCDIEKMFHQFRVDKEDRDYLRFIWKDEDYRMKVHLFGATSSPGCANYGLKQIAKDNKSHSERASYFINRNFYVDDGLTSVSSVEEAKELVKETREMCAKGKLRLHKFVSNSREVMESIPPSERAKEMENLELSFGTPQIERALGIHWCVESDTFQFRLMLKDQPLTRRGILSTVASVYDPLGFLAPFVLRGKQILQEMCRDGTGWDDPLPDALHQQWEIWRNDLLELSQVKIQRSFQPDNGGRVKRYEIHHFSDASTTGYGQCSYIRLVNENDKVHCSLILGTCYPTVSGHDSKTGIASSSGISPDEQPAQARVGV